MQKVNLLLLLGDMWSTGSTAVRVAMIAGAVALVAMGYGAGLLTLLLGG